MTVPRIDQSKTPGRRKIVLLSDGTGNSSAKAQRTNVWRLFQALDQGEPEQLAMYDDGVGASSNKYLAALGGVFGWGLKRNVIDLYTFVCRNFTKGTGIDTDIYGFGFSRGAFTIRVLVGLIITEGLVTFRSEEELGRNAAAAYRHYRAARFPSWSPIVITMRKLRDLLFWGRNRIRGHQTYREVAAETEKARRTNIPIKFLGLWDTVEAYGMPIAELKYGMRVLWPMMFGDLKLSRSVGRACHALALDDERTTFHPLLWDEAAEAEMVRDKVVSKGRITQVWFAGVHSNVGGGYPEDQLSLMPLRWMMDEAQTSGLVLNQAAVAEIEAARSPYARLYDSRAGFWAYYRYGPRDMGGAGYNADKTILPIVDGSVLMRMAYGSDQYAPIVLPRDFLVRAPDGELLPMKGFPTVRVSAPLLKASSSIEAEKVKLRAAIDALDRPTQDAVDLVRDTVWWRRLCYFVTIGLTAVLVAYPFLSGGLTAASRGLVRAVPLVGTSLDEQWQKALEKLEGGSRGPITSVVETLSGFIPSYLASWIKELETHPIEFVSIVAAVLLSLHVGRMLQSRIYDRARFAWHNSLKQHYAEWLSEAERGARNGSAAALAVAALVAAAAYRLEWAARHELGALVAILAAVTLWRVRRLTHIKATLGPERQAAVLPTTFALALARKLRSSRELAGVYRWVSRSAVPFTFAVGLVAGGAYMANRALFDVFSSAGHFCRSELARDASKTEKIGSKDGFDTASMCWASGLVLEEGGRYRIVVVTPGDWFDRAIHTDVGGFPADSVRHASATLLKRWWRENWFKPIARIGKTGNDEYALDPVAPFRSHSYTVRAATPDGGVRAKISEGAAREVMRADPTPDSRKVLVAEITARTSGELFLYVNDAILMWPGATDLFFSNNSGTGTVTVERIKPEWPAARKTERGVAASPR